MTTKMFSILVGLAAGCLVGAICLLVADLWLYWQIWQEKKQTKKKTPKG